MPRVVFAPALARWRSAEPGLSTGEWAVAADGATVRDLLQAVFVIHPLLRGYVLDERGAMRHHVVAFVNGEPVRDKDALSDPVPADAEVYIFQALSGG
jgi:molybdopterin synthase sulfur carrier subunit